METNQIIIGVRFLSNLYYIFTKLSLPDIWHPVDNQYKRAAPLASSELHAEPAHHNQIPSQFTAHSKVKQ